MFAQLSDVRKVWYYAHVLFAHNPHCASNKHPFVCVYLCAPLGHQPTIRSDWFTYKVDRWRQLRDTISEETNEKAHQRGWHEYALLRLGGAIVLVYCYWGFSYEIDHDGTNNPSTQNIQPLVGEIKFIGFMAHWIVTKKLMNHSKFWDRRPIFVYV